MSRYALTVFPVRLFARDCFPNTVIVEHTLGHITRFARTPICVVRSLAFVRGILPPPDPVGASLQSHPPLRVAIQLGVVLRAKHHGGTTREQLGEIRPATVWKSPYRSSKTCLSHVGMRFTPVQQACAPNEPTANILHGYGPSNFGCASRLSRSWGHRDAGTDALQTCRKRLTAIA